MRQILYLRANILIAQQGVADLTRVKIPIKTVMYDGFFHGVTLKKMVEKDLRNRLKGVQYCLITLEEVSKYLLQCQFQASETDFATYDPQQILVKHPKPLKPLKKPVVSQPS